MDQDLNKLLFELLGVLSDATKKITEVLCRQAVKQAQPSSDQPTLVAQVAQKVQQVASALERVQEDHEVACDSQEVPAEEPVGELEQPAASLSEQPPFRRRSRLTITEAELRKLYIEEDLPARIIAERYRVSAAAINQRLRLWGIQKRGTRRQVIPAAPNRGEAVEEDSVETAQTSAEESPKNYEPDPDAIHEAEEAFHDEEAPVTKSRGNGNVGGAKKKFRLIGRRQ